MVKITFSSFLKVWLWKKETKQKQQQQKKYEQWPFSH